MTNRLWKVLWVGVAAAGVAVFAQEGAQPLFKRQVQAHPAPEFDDVMGREYKFLLDPAKAKGAPAEALKEIWSRVKTGAAQWGFQVTEKGKNPLKVEMTTKEYFDTPDQALWKSGYLIRITTKYKAGIAEAAGKVTVKAIFEDPARTLAAPLEASGVKAEHECQDNVGPGKGGVLVGYLEKGVSFTVDLDELGKRTVGDFARFVPQLGKLGIPPGTALVSHRAYSYRMRPGHVVLPGTEPCGVSMEGWSLTEGGPIFLYDFSYGYEDLTLYENPETHLAGERFMATVLQEGLAPLAYADDGRWGGSKVRVFMKRPIGR